MGFSHALGLTKDARAYEILINLSDMCCSSEGFLFRTKHVFKYRRVVQQSTLQFATCFGKFWRGRLRRVRTKIGFAVIKPFQEACQVYGSYNLLKESTNLIFYSMKHLMCILKAYVSVCVCVFYFSCLTCFIVL